MRIENLLAAGAASAAAGALATGAAPIAAAAGITSLALLSIRNSRYDPTTFIHKTVLTALYALGNFGTAEAVVNGRLPSNPDANSAVPLLRCGKGSCTGFRLNQHQVMTAKHCVRDSRTHKDKNCSVVIDDERIFPNKTEWNPKLDIALLTFNETLPGVNVCVPAWMTFDDFKVSTRGQDIGNSTCGNQAGSMIVAGRGKKVISAKSCNQSSKELSAGRFRRSHHSAGPREGRAQEQYYRGIMAENPQATANSGDSGGLVMMCNTKTRQFQTVGVHSLGYHRSFHDDDVGFNNKLSAFVAVSKAKASLDWVKNKMLHSCTGTVLQAQDFISQNLAPKPKPAPISTCVSARFGQRHGKDRIIINNNCKCAIKLEFGSKKRVIFSKRDRAIDLHEVKKGLTAKYLHLPEENEPQDGEELNLSDILSE